MSDEFINKINAQLNTNGDNKFINIRPKFVKPTGTEDILNSVVKDNRPATPLKDQGSSRKIQELLTQAKLLSAKEAKITNIQSKTRNTTAEISKSKISFCEAHIIEDDKEFLKIVRTMSAFDKGAKNLLLANGGSKYLSNGLTLSQAWDALRKERQNNLLKTPDQSFDKRPQFKAQYKAYIKGKPNEEDLWRKAWQSKVNDKDE